MFGNNVCQGGFAKTRRSMQQSHSLLGSALYIPFFNYLQQMQGYGGEMQKEVKPLPAVDQS